MNDVKQTGISLQQIYDYSHKQTEQFRKKCDKGDKTIGEIAKSAAAIEADLYKAANQTNYILLISHALTEIGNAERRFDRDGDTTPYSQSYLTAISGIENEIKAFTDTTPYKDTIRDKFG
ncbi:MAG: hypothetical protein ABIC04_02750 [Nanoarchaeota archaeon]